MQTRRPDEVIIQYDREGVGAGVTRNQAWRRASTDYVAFLDDDDELLPEHLEVCMTAALARDADVVYPWFELVGWSDATLDRPDPLATKLDGELVHPLGVDFGPEQAAHLLEYPWIPATVVVRRSALEEVGGYPSLAEAEYEESQGCEDWALLKRLLRAGASFVHVPRRTWVCHLDGTKSTAGRPWTSVYGS